MTPQGEIPKDAAIRCSGDAVTEVPWNSFIDIKKYCFNYSEVSLSYSTLVTTLNVVSFLYSASEHVTETRSISAVDPGVVGLQIKKECVSYMYSTSSYSNNTCICVVMLHNFIIQLPL